MISVRLMKLFILYTISIFIMLLNIGQGSAGAELKLIDCGTGKEPLGYLGITGLNCRCSYFEGSDTEDKFWHFQSEPEIRSVDMQGPAGNKLKSGDKIVAINGMLITTHNAGHLYANPVPGDTLEIQVRRGYGMVTHRVQVGQTCPNGSKTSGEDSSLIENGLLRFAKALESIDWEKALDKTFEPDEDSLLPKAWLGMAMECSGCCMKRTGAHTPAEWHFGSFPEVYAVHENSPAEQAGFKTGDLITHINGIPIDQHEGGLLFSGIKPGEEVTWTVTRDGKELYLIMYAEAPPIPARSDKTHDWLLKPAIQQEIEITRFSGSLGDTEIEVKGSDPIEVFKYDAEGKIIIHAGNTKIKLHLSTKK